jgi:hypothetical protein
MISARFSTVGADARWLAALGRAIAARQGVPSGVPFAAAPSVHFPNVLVLAELIFYGLERSLGDRGLMLAQLLAVATAMLVLGRDALARGASSGGVAAALGVAAVGAFPSLAIVRVQLFSLALLPILLALLRSETRSPSRRIWLAVPLIAVWSNLHGAVLIGFGITCCYLLFDRFRLEPALALLVIAATALAICVTPAGAETVSYYHRVLTNVSLQRGIGLWSPLSPSHPFDDILVIAGLVLAVGLPRARLARWELLALLVLAAATVDASRDGIWLLFFLVAPGAYAIRFKRQSPRVLVPSLILAIALISYSIIQGPAPSGAQTTTVLRAMHLAKGTPVLASDIVAEQVALAGGRVWISNPLEEFSHHDQAAYLDWLQGLPSGRMALGSNIAVVLVTRGSGTQQLMSHTRGFVRVPGDRRTVIYVRSRLRGSGPGAQAVAP